MSPLGRFTWRWRRTAWWDGYYQGWADAEGGHRRLRDRAERLRLYDSSGITTRTSLAADCTCTPCPGRGNDGECCFGSGIGDADPACPVVPHRSLAALSSAPADPPAGREQDARETLTDVLVAHQRKDTGSCLCGWSELGLSHARHQADAVLAALDLLPSPPATTGAGPLVERDHVEPTEGLDLAQRIDLNGVRVLLRGPHEAVREVLGAIKSLAAPSPPATDGDTAARPHELTPSGGPSPRHAPWCWCGKGGPR